MILLAIALAAVLFAEPVEVLVLRSGHRIAVAGEIRQDGSRLVFTTAEGKLYSLAVEEVDLEATRERTPATEKAAVAEEPAPKPAKPPARSKLAVSEQEKRRLLDELSHNREGKAAPAPPEATDEGLARELDEIDRERAERERDESYWRSKARPARERLLQARGEVAALEERIERLEDEVRLVFNLGLDPAGQLDQLAFAKNRLDAARQQVGAAERAWDELQEDARREGALPGWLR